MAFAYKFEFLNDLGIGSKNGLQADLKTILVLKKYSILQLGPTLVYLFLRVANF